MPYEQMIRSDLRGNNNLVGIVDEHCNALRAEEYRWAMPTLLDLHRGTGRVIQRIPKELGQADSENLRSGPPELPQACPEKWGTPFKE